MKTSLIFVVGFAVLAVAVSRPPYKEKAKEAKRIQVPFEDAMISAAEWALEYDPEYRDAVNAKSQPTEEPETQNGELLIPSPNSLALKSDPIALGCKIGMLDEEEQDEYIDEMEDLMEEYEDTIIGDFYEAAIDAIDDSEDESEDESEDWDDVIDDAKEYGEAMAKNFPGIENLFKPNTSLKIINDILEADPLDAAKRSGIPIELHIGTGSSGSLVVASSFINVYSISGKVKGTIQRLILDRIAENGGVENFYRNYFNTASSNPHKAGVR